MRAQRLLSILMHLQVHRRMTARELAQKLEVSERTILRDMDALGGAGIPVTAARGAGGGWSLLREYETRLTGLSPEEAQSLFAAGPPQLMADLGLQETAATAWIKLLAALPVEARRHAHFMRERVLMDARGWRSAAEAAASLPALLDALWRERKVRFVYESTLSGASERTADPLGLVARGSTWYLIAQRGGELRTYRVSRIRGVELLADAAERPGDFDLSVYWQRAAAEFREKLPQYRATFLARPEVMRWVRYRGWRLEKEEEQGGRLRVQLRFDVEEEAIQFALSFGGDVEAVEPAELRGKVAAGARKALRVHGKRP